MPTLQELEHCQAVVLSVVDEAGVQTVVEQLLAGARQPSQRRAAVALLCAFCAHSRAPLTPHVPQLLRELLRLFTDTDRHVLQLAGEALAAVTKTLDTNQQIEYVMDVRQAIRFAASDLKGQEYLPGFCQEKGISPILPIFREAILIGVPELKEQAAQGLGEVIRLTDAASLRQSVISITGPLIRIIGDRFSFSVKVAVLETLALLLAKVGVQLKPFLPQLQTTFLKALNDGNRQVRLKASVALSHLIVLHTRCDPVFQELHNSVKNQDDPTVRETMLYALHRVVAAAGHKMSDLMRRSVTASVSSYLSSSEDGCRTAAAGCLGSLCRWLPPDELAVFAREHLLSDDPSEDWTLRHGCSVTLSVALKQAPERILTDDWRERVFKTLIKYMTADRCVKPRCTEVPLAACRITPAVATMATRGPYRTLDLATKVKIMKEVEEGGIAKQDIARRYGIKPNTLSNFLKNKRSILEAVEKDQFKMSRKRMRTSAHPELEQALLIWIREARSNHLPLSGDIVAPKASSLAAIASVAGVGSSSPAGEADTSELDDHTLQAAFGDVTFEEYVAVDGSVEMCGTLTDSQIIEMVRPNEAANESDEDYNILSEPQPAAADVAAGLAIAQRFFAAESNADEALGHVYSLQNLLSVPIVIGGVRGTGHCLRHMLLNSEELPQVLLTTFAKCLNHGSNEVKQLVAQTVQWLSRSLDKGAPPQLLRTLVPQLVNGTKEKNTMVRANSEYALVALLHLRTSTQGLEGALS
ncbi:hypothetical protein HPB49_007290 [Dermacentor silvarum]|uniref:Uncharacterized protein n=1 Tax=Dermacentor silvarum TaxID=543639 RepID=A0ACB8D3P5_DERSI|nr:hypothetical protein HPB49_007290 [Dermacentor silvarum]